MNEGTAKNSLINALETLERKSIELTDLANFSDNVLYKFNNPRPVPEKDGDLGCVLKSCENEQIPNIIDLFYKVADRIDLSINRIQNNTRILNDFIE